MSSIASDAPNLDHLRLIAAAARGNDTQLQQIYSSKQDWTSYADRTVLRQALQKAAAKGALEVVRLLIKWSAEVEPRRENEASPLFKAVEGRHPLVAKELLACGANPNWRRPRDGLTALFIAYLHGLHSVTLALLAAGADANARNHAGRTPLLHAAMEKSSVWRMETLHLLLDKGADIEARDGIGRTALHWASANGNMAAADALLGGRLGAVADISATSNRGMTAIYLAAEKNHDFMVRYLLERGADARAVGDGGWTALHIAARNGYLDVARMLLDAGADINAQLPNGMAPLHWAAMGGHEEVVKLLLARPEAKLDIKDNFNRTPLLCAAERRQREIIRLLSPRQAVDDTLSAAARGACQGFEATVVDFGSFRYGKKRLVFKHSVYDLLYSWNAATDKPAVTVSPKNVKHQPDFRWIHLPANNIAWAEALLQKWFAEGGYRDIESFQALNACFDQEQHGPLAHHHAMRPFCQRIVPPRLDVVDQGSRSALRRNARQDGSALPQKGAAEQFMTSKGMRHARGKRRARMANMAPEPPSAPERPSSPERPSVPEPETPATPGSMVLFMPFLHYETGDQRQKMENAIKLASSGKDVPETRSPDILLLNGYVNRERPVHVRRTLDQYFYSSIETSGRDMDQVVLRYCKKHGLEHRMLMVDQLWLWVLGNDIVITCFAERWERPKRDPLNVLDGIIEGINGEQDVASAYHLAAIIFSQCCNTFDRPRVDQDYEFLGMFENSIGSIVSRQAVLLQRFDQATKQSTLWLRDRRRHGARSDRVRSLQGEHDNVLDALLELGDESAMLNEINDIRDELNIIEVILGAQTALLETLDAAVAEELRQGAESEAVRNGLAAQLQRQWQALQRQIDTRQRDLQRMDRRAENVYTGLRSLLELKQMQSNALEAKFARDQAVTASKQGQAILVFTVVTIVFLPMSFMATLFTINMDVWSDPLPLPYVAKYTFGIGLGISIPLVVMALTVTDIIVAIKWFLVETKNRLVSGWAPSPEIGEFEIAPGETIVAHTPAADSPSLEKTLPKVTVCSPRRLELHEESIGDARSTRLHGRGRSQGLFRGSNHSIAWVRQSMERGRSRKSDDPERGRSLS